MDTLPGEKNRTKQNRTKEPPTLVDRQYIVLKTTQNLTSNEPPFVIIRINSIAAGSTCDLMADRTQDEGSYDRPRHDTEDSSLQVISETMTHESTCRKRKQYDLVLLAVSAMSL
jgi:hypothetical protein